jgi:molybdopterin molybdotransferase
MALLAVEEALERLLARAVPGSATQTVALADAHGRVLANPIAARLTQPPFDASAMDGYALRAADVATLGSRLAVIGQSAAGHAFAGEVRAGQAVRIFTGAPMPAGADTVLLQEDAVSVGEGLIENAFSPDKGRHVRPRGQDFVEGETVLDAGLVLDAGRLLVAAGMNHPTLNVYRKPLIAIIATGDELLPAGSVLGPSQIIASSTPAITTLARGAGADVLDLGIVPDRSDLIAQAVGKAVAAGADVLVTLGGASVGDHDLVQATLKSVGMQLDFWRIAMRPGKPLMVGSLGAMHVLGLPGNPVSSMVCALLFLEPLLARLAHVPFRTRLRQAKTTTDLPENDHRQDYLRAQASIGPDGSLKVTSYGKQDSSQMKIFARSDALLVRPPHAPALPAGFSCQILLLREVRR